MLNWIFARWTERALPEPGRTTFAFPQPDVPHLATVRERIRSSGLTSVRFLDDTTLITGDFGGKCLYLVRLDGDKMTILDRHDSVIASGEAVETDLMDYHDGRVIVSNFYQGTFSLYEIADGKIRFFREVAAGGPRNMHGLRFVPGASHLVWLTFCNAKDPCHIIYDLADDRVLHRLSTAQQCQDVAFVNGHAVVFARTDHITKGAVTRIHLKKRVMYATAYVYRLPDNLETAPPVLVSTWRGRGHIDACVETEGDRILSANQYLDRVDVFALDPSGRLRLQGFVPGFRLPHGLDVRGDKVAVTNYGDQTLDVIDRPA